MSTLGKGRKSIRRYLVEGNKNIEHGGDRLAKVSLIFSRATSIPCRLEIKNQFAKKLLKDYASNCYLLFKSRCLTSQTNVYQFQEFLKIEMNVTIIFPEKAQFAK